MENFKILDSDTTDNKKEYRIGAILLEFLPIIFTTIYAFITGETFILMLLMPLASLIYLTFGWYIFKKKKYQIKEIVIAELVGVYFLPTNTPQTPAQSHTSPPPAVSKPQSQKSLPFSPS